LPEKIRLHPLPVFKLVGDLSVDTGVWFREMAEKSEAWIHAKEAFDPGAKEDRMDDELAQKIYDSDRCIECGCCVASCGVANINGEFAGPAGLNRMARFNCLSLRCMPTCAEKLFRPGWPASVSRFRA
jgi:fumarate reductase iron-sulfur subunit